MKQIHKIEVGNYSKCGFYLGATKGKSKNTFDVTCPICKLLIFNENAKYITPYNRVTHKFRPRLLSPNGENK